MELHRPVKIESPIGQFEKYCSSCSLQIQGECRFWLTCPMVRARVLSKTLNLLKIGYRK